MDWNKSNSILIIAFIIVNIFLLVVTFADVISNENVEIVDEKFIISMENMLKQKGININCKIPNEVYNLPFLETVYEIIIPNKSLIEKFLGEDIEVSEDITIYENALGQRLEIINGKKILYTDREPIYDKTIDDKFAEQAISSFLKLKNLDIENFEKQYEYNSENKSYMLFTTKYTNISLDNSYNVFYIDSKGVYKYESQKIDKIIESKVKKRVVSASEALIRLLTHDEINNKDIIDIQISYYSKEDENWQHITKTNADPIWKVIFSDGSIVHLTSDD